MSIFEAIEKTSEKEICMVEDQIILRVLYNLIPHTITDEEIKHKLLITIDECELNLCEKIKKKSQVSLIREGASLEN